MIQATDLYKATRDGLDIILRYYPQAADVVGTKNKFRARQNEKTASACLHYSGGVWKVVDFGDDGHGLSPIDICMKEEGITHFYEAVLLLAGIIGINEELSPSINKPRIEKRPATSEEKEGTRIFSLLESIPEEHLKVLGPKVRAEHAEALNWYEAEYVGYVKNREVTLKYSTENYPIFMRECRTDDGKVFYKIYEPLNPEKQWRFSYTPEGVKPKDYINGLRELQEQFGKLNSCDDEEEGEQRERKLEEIFICSGERDALCLKSMGYIPIWFNSETYTLTESEVAKLYRYADTIYNIPDIDATGRKKGAELALRHIDIYTVWLPEWLSTYRDNRGKPRKDLRDWQELRRDVADFRDLIKMAMPAKFWVETINEKSGKRELSISAVRLYYFLQLNGFRTLRDANAANTRYIQVTGNIVKQIKAKDVRRFVREWAEERCLAENIRNLIVNSMKFSETSLENLREVELDFTTFTPTTQLFFFTRKSIEVTPSEIIVHQKGDTSFQHYVWEDNVLPYEFTVMPDMFSITRSEQGGKPHFDIEVLESGKSCLCGYVINSSRIYWRKEMEYRFGEDREAAAEYAATHRFCIDGEGLTPTEIAEQKQNLINKIFAIGYMLHRYKSPSRAWAPQAMDNKIGENGECNGRSGKSFLFKALSMFMRTVKLSGRNPKLMDNPHVFDQVNIHTDFVLVDDCAQYLSMGLFYDIITSDMTVNPKNNQSYSIPFEQSPKFGFTTNYVPLDFDSSTEARMLYMVYSDYYHQLTETNDYLETRSIRDDFGRDLFTHDYSPADWNADINFLMQCLRFYLSLCRENIKILPPMDNILLRKYRQDIGNNFEDWANGYFAEDGDKLDKLLIRREVFDDYRKYANVTNLTMQRFTQKLHSFCHLCPYIDTLNPDELCNNQKRISRRVEGNFVDMIFVQTKRYKEKKNDPNEFIPDEQFL